MKKVGLLLWKDVLSEVRSLERIATVVLFAVAVLVTMNFALAPGSDARPKAAAGFCWAAVVLASVLEFRRSFDSERRDGTLDGLRAAPLDPTLLYVAKALSSFAVVGVLAVVLVPLTSLFFVEPAGPPAHLERTAASIGIALLGAAGLVAWGTLFAAVTSGGRASDVVLPALLFPLVVPQTIACVRLLALTMTGEQLADATTGLVILGAFDLLSWGTSLLLFEYVLDE
jgi:heme exporter protein B